MTTDELDQICAIRSALFREHRERPHTHPAGCARAGRQHMIAAVIARLRQQDPRRSFEFVVAGVGADA